MSTNLEAAVAEELIEKRQLTERLHQLENGLRTANTEIERLRGQFSELDHQLDVAKKERDYYIRWTGELTRELKNIGALAQQAIRDVGQRMGQEPTPPAPLPLPPQFKGNAGKVARENPAP